MKKSESGAAHVSLMWVIFLIVLVLSLSGFTYIAWRDKADKEDERLTALEEAKKLEARIFEEGQKTISLSKIVGFRDDVAGSLSSITTIKDRIDLLKPDFQDHIMSADTTLEQVISGLLEAHSLAVRQLNEKATQLDTEIKTREQCQDKLRTITADKDSTIMQLETSLSDEQQRSANQGDEFNQRINNQQTQIDDLGNRIREVEARAESEKQVSQKEISTLKARIQSLSAKLEVLKEPDLPDGEVIAAAAKTGNELVSINVGGRDLLRRGTKFDVFRYGKGGELVLKGRIVVRDVARDTSVCGIIETVDKMDPIVKGDVVVNPLFARNMERNYVLLGRFPGSLNKGFISDRLKALGGAVQDNVSSNTDFLVLGNKEEGEFAQELTDSPEYKLADKLGVQIVRLNDIMDFIRY